MNANMRVSRRKFLNLITLGMLGISCFGAWGFGTHVKTTMYDGDVLLSDLDEISCRLNYSKTLASFDPYESNLVKQSFDAIEAQAHVIAVVRPTGKRKIGVRSIVSEVIVENVYKGNVQAGSTISLLESMDLISRDALSKDVLQQDSSKTMRLADRYVLFPEDPYVVGFTLMDAAQQYLIFVHEIPAATINGKEWGKPLYEVFRNVYSRISLSDKASINIVKKGESEKKVKELKSFNIIVSDDEYAQLYAIHSEKILHRYLGSNEL